MRHNFRGDKRRKEELRKKKQEEKRNKRLNKKATVASSDLPVDGTPVQTGDPNVT